jgi:aminopeptidase N
MSCRHCSHAFAAALDTRSFPLPGDVPKWARARPFPVEATTIAVRVLLAERSVEGVATIDARRVDRTKSELELDAIDLDVSEVVLVEGGATRPATFQNDGRTLRIAVPLDVKNVRVRVTYRATPRRGLYFITRRELRAPLVAEDALPTEVWSQGQDEDNRHWFPCQDHPGERMRVELLATVPAGFTALGNGVLVSKTEARGEVTFHYKQDEPIPPYLVTLAAGRFEEAHDSLAATDARGALPVDYYVPVGHGEAIARSLGKTPKMIAHFEKKLGTAFPWAKYAQVVVSDFIFGGMENTSATTLFDRVLLDPRAALDVDMDSLVSHELAHQWFGDLVTCRDWSHAWLNEGFATYLEHVWREEDEGIDAYHHGLEQDLETYLDEDSSRYRRAIVTNVWSSPIDLFDRHLYQKGGLVLHALRQHLGDDAFFAGLQHYLARMRGQGAETRDLMRAMEDATGRSLEAFFDQWIAKPGHPALEVSSEFETGVLRVTVVEKNTKAGEPSAFVVALPLQVISDEGTTVHVVEVSKARETFAIPVKGTPKMVLVDPEMHVIGTLDNRLATGLLIEQLKSASLARPRWRAARALGTRNEPRAVEALSASLTNDAFWAVRAECAAALGDQRTPRAFTALVSSVGDPSPRVRRAVASALGRFRTAASADALMAWIERGDASYLVEAELRRSLGKTRDERALGVLTARYASDPVSWNECVVQGAVDGLGATKQPGAIPTLLDALDARHASSVRRSAISALSHAREVTTDEPLIDRIRLAIEGVLETFDPGLRIFGARALASLRDSRSGSAMTRLVDRDLDGRVRRAARESLRDLRDRTVRGREVGALRDDLEKLRTELRELREKVALQDAKKSEPSSSK